MPTDEPTKTDGDAPETGALLDKIDRLERHVRSLAAVNRQLRAQLDGEGIRAVGLPGIDDPVATLADSVTPDSRGKRHQELARNWCADLVALGEVDTEVVFGPGGVVLLVEAGRKRPIPGGLLAACIIEKFGPGRVAEPAELDAWADGPPVELFTQGGTQLVVIGGRRWTVRGFPSGVEVGPSALSDLQEGGQLDAAGALMPRPGVALNWLPARFGVAAGPKGAVELVKRRISR